MRASAAIAQLGERKTEDLEVEGECSSFLQILSRREKQLEADEALLTAGVKKQDQEIDKKISELYQEFAQQKPGTQGEGFSSVGLSSLLKKFSVRVSGLAKELEKVIEAKEALGMDCRNKGDLEVREGRGGRGRRWVTEGIAPLQGLSSELESLQSVWKDIGGVMGKVEEVGSTSWGGIDTKRVRLSLDELLEELNAMPARVQVFSAFDDLCRTVKNGISRNTLIGELKSPAVKEQHFKQIIKVLKLEQTLQGQGEGPSLSDLWKAPGLDPKSPSETTKEVRSILAQAQGEMGLSEFLSQVDAEWKERKVDLVPYRNHRIKLIKGWDSLFEALDEHLASLNSMRHSPYFKPFEAQGSAWQQKLTFLRHLMDVWMEVQRRYVYLEGIFFGAGGDDLRQLLPQEAAKFQGIDSDYLGLMKRVAARPVALELAQEGNLRVLERISSLLSKVQKALGEYLEQQRKDFSRFFFVGDEDLLEILGNGQDTPTVDKHVGKMFAGLARLLAGEAEGKMVRGVASREGEELLFESPVDLKKHPSTSDWLQTSVKEMKATMGSQLALLLKSSNLLGEAGALVATSPSPEIPKSLACLQMVLLACKVQWTDACSQALGSAEKLGSLAAQLESCLAVIATSLSSGSFGRMARKKSEQLIIELVDLRDKTRMLRDSVGETGLSSFKWQGLLRAQWSGEEKEVAMCIANASFGFSFEYYGLADRLVQTPLTDQCYLVLTQALNLGLGGNPFGPAGTGKTETVKALGAQLGRFVVVFCCDESFDFMAMGRIFVGLCQVGAWGCFDEFNRLEEKMLSAVSEQILAIQLGLQQSLSKITLLKQSVSLSRNVGIFITMNPTYEGRSALPDNLVQLFRQVAMIVPNRPLIAQVMLYAQGFSCAESLASKAVDLFSASEATLSKQAHYDFGLRSMKAVLLAAGRILKAAKADTSERASRRNSTLEQDPTLRHDFESSVLVRALSHTMLPQMVAGDAPRFLQLLGEVLPSSKSAASDDSLLVETLQNICESTSLRATDAFVKKCLQIYHIQQISVGILLVGPVGSGKTAVWRTLLAALDDLEGSQSESHVIDPKALSKADLFGKLDNTTLEWSDGVFTRILRSILSNQRGELSRRQWIVFDGNIDPEWVENLNSVLDDNRALTLPNGERLSIPDNCRILIETDSLKHATMATISRCGMVWISEGAVVSPEMTAIKAISSLKDEVGEVLYNLLQDLTQHFSSSGFVATSLAHAASLKDHVMPFTFARALTSLFCLLKGKLLGYKDVIENLSSSEFESQQFDFAALTSSDLVWATLWGLGSSLPMDSRSDFALKLSQEVAETGGGISLPPGNLLDFSPPKLGNLNWIPWQSQIPSLQVDPKNVCDADLVICTVDTLRHNMVLRSCLSSRKPFLLCGPPGSGKTMTLMSTFQAGEMEMIPMNFSSETKPEHLLKTLQSACEYYTFNGKLFLRPRSPEKWLIVFCDEINLASPDKFGTQEVIMLLRQLVASGGFYRTSDKQWVTAERICFVGACNPPTDAGRHPMSDRFLRHVPIIFVDYPSRAALEQIFLPFNEGMLSLQPQLSSLAGPLTQAMVGVYSDCKVEFTVEKQPHYLFSPRELTRWKLAIFRCVATSPAMSRSELFRLFAHEGLRIFADRLVELEEREIAGRSIEKQLKNCFGLSDEELREATQQPIVFCKLLQGRYEEWTVADLRKFILSKISAFCEEECSVKLSIFESVVHHITRIDRVLAQPSGHCLLVGASGAGKTILPRFVSWLNGCALFMIKTGQNYDIAAFEADLRSVMRRAGVGTGEKICFLIDESNVLGPAFLELMNALLASGEVPGLFSGEEWQSLMMELKAGKKGSEEDPSELYAGFIEKVRGNLHIVFTMNPASPDFQNRKATSPALFNRCVINWIGDWEKDALEQVAVDFLSESLEGEDAETEVISLLSQALVEAHKHAGKVNEMLRDKGHPHNFTTPRDYLDLISHFTRIHTEKLKELNEQRSHLQSGLSKLKDTETQVDRMRTDLRLKEKELEKKNKEAEKKMELMVERQTEAESNKKESEKMVKLIEEQKLQVAERKEVAEKELESSEPALEKAKKLVSGIKKSQLDEIRSLQRPPDCVKVALEAVVVMINNYGPDRELTWDLIRSEMRSAGFIGNILSFNSDGLRPETLSHIRETYLETPGWDLQKMDRASKAAGPLAVWVQTQVDYVDILLAIGPLREEITQLEKDSVLLSEELQEKSKRLASLEALIDSSKREYAELISQVEQIKQEMKGVALLVERSEKLLASLDEEQVRWHEQEAGFDENRKSLNGTCILVAGFMAYAGFFDFFNREVFVNEMKETLTGAGFKLQKNLSLSDFLSSPAQRLQWRSCGLGDDVVSQQNVLLLARHNRYPLILDPSGQALKFLEKLHKAEGGPSLTHASISDKAVFMKALEAALRFGNHLLVTDVERADPTLNSVLNKEVYKRAGRLLIAVGNAEIDYSPSFSMFLSTRDSSAQFTPDLCSRVTLVNFTVSTESLQNQCLQIALASEQKDVEERRANLLKVQSEFRIRIRQLEDSVLDAISKTEGSILENTTLMQTLECLKAEAADIAQKAADADIVAMEVKAVSDVYSSFALSSAHLFGLLQDLSLLHPLYHFSLREFLLVFDQSIKEGGMVKGGHRPHILWGVLVRKVFSSLSTSLVTQDRLVFALRILDLQLSLESKVLPQKLVKFMVKCVSSTGLSQLLMDSEEVGELEQLDVKLNLFQQKNLQILQNVDPDFFGLLLQAINDDPSWKPFIEGGREDGLPELPPSFPFEEESAEVCKIALKLCLRPDLVQKNLESWLDACLGLEMSKVELELSSLIKSGSNLFVLASSRGFDSSRKVVDLANALNFRLSSVAMGSSEGYSQAEHAVLLGMKEGSWVMLKNVHLSSFWLPEVERLLHKNQQSMKKEFKLFLTLDMTRCSGRHSVPPTLLRASKLLIFEAPSGLKASVKRSIGSELSPEKSEAEPAPSIRCRLHTLLAWLHALVTERGRYVPVGWTKVYEFSAADLTCAVRQCDRLLNAVTKGRAGHIELHQVPWEAIRELLIKVTYGGRVDECKDRATLEEIVGSLIRPEAFEENFQLAPGLSLPLSLRRLVDVTAWVEQLDARSHPEWAYLPLDVEKVPKIGAALSTVKKWNELKTKGQR